MKMYRSVRSICGSLTLVAAIFALGGAGLGQTAYFTLTDLGKLPGHTRSEPAALNNLGQVVGVSLVPNSWDYRAFLYRDDHMIDLGTYGWDASVATDINDAGQIVVNCFRPDPNHPGFGINHAFLTREGTWTELGASYPWKNSVGHSINAWGQAVGEERDDDDFFAFLYYGSDKHYLAAADRILTNSTAFSINDAGQILVADEDGTYIHYGSTLTPFTLPGNGNWSLHAINNLGQVVGHFEADDPGATGPDGETLSRRHAFLYGGGVVTDLSKTNCLDSVAFDSNSHGQTVGYCLTAGEGRMAEPHAVLFQDGGVLDLNQMIPRDSGWLLMYANAINDLGQIACLANSNGVRAVLLTPPLCTLTPATATNRVGETHEVTCTVVSNQVPLVGVSVEFSVISGPNAGQPGTTDLKSTDAAGQARFRYTGDKGGGTDVIQARARLGPLALVASAKKTWEAGIELHPRIVLGCPGGTADLELIDLATGLNIADDPSVDYEWVGDNWLSNLAWKALAQVLPQVAGWRASLSVNKGRVTFETKGVNLINAKRKTAQGEIKSNYAFVAAGVLELNTLDSIQIGPLTVLNLAADQASGRIASMFDADFPVRMPMVLFPVEQTPCSTVVQKLGNRGLVELRSVKFNFLGGLISDVDLMNAVGPLVGLVSKAFPLAWLAEGLSTRAAEVGAAQFLDFKVSSVSSDPKEKNPFIDLAKDNSEFPYVRGMVTAKKSGLAAVQATLNLEKYCLGKATDLMWVWVLPDLEKVDIRNGQGQLVRDALNQESPLGVWVKQSAQARAVGLFKNFAEAGSIPIKFDPFGVKDSDLAKLAEKLLPGYEKIKERVGVSIPIRYPLGATVGPGGMYEAGATYLALTLTYLPLEPAIRVDEFQLQLGIWNGFNTWALEPTPNPYATLDSSLASFATLTGVAPGLTDLRLDTCIYGLSKASDTARVRVMANDPVCTVRPAALTLAIGAETTLEATIEVDGQPAPPGEVNFVVMSGPNAGKKGSGQGPVAHFSYKGDGGSGTDRIEVVGQVWGKLCGGSATRTWETSKAFCALTPASATNQVGTSHTVTAAVTSGGQPAVGAVVHFLVSSGPNHGAGGQFTTSAAGQARFTYLGQNGPGTDLIEAAGLVDNASFYASATKTWIPEPEKSADLKLTKTVLSSAAKVGQPLAYLLTIRNLGPDKATGVTLTESLPPEADLVSVSASQGSCVGSGPVTCGLGDLALRAAVTVTLTVNPRRAGTLVNSASVTAREKDPNPANNQATVQTPVSEAPSDNKADLAVSLSHAPAVIYPGQLLSYQVTVRNLGPSRATGIQVTDALSEPVRLVSATPSQGECRGLGPYGWNVGSLATNASASLTLVVRPMRPGYLNATAAVTGTRPDPNSQNNQAADPLTVASGPVITRITPMAAPVSVEEVELKIEGAGFDPGAVISFQPAAGLEVWDEGVPDFGYYGPTELRRYVTMGADAAPGPREVFVTNPSGAAGGGLPYGQFTVLAANQPLPPPEGMRLWLTGDGTAGDLLGKNPGRLLKGASADAPGRVGAAFRFDGVDDAVEVPNSPEINAAGAAPMTLELWVYWTSRASVMYLLGKQEGCDDSRLQYRLGYTPDQGIFFETPTALVSSWEDLPLNRWTHIAVTSYTNEIGVHVDGFLCGLDDGQLGPATSAPLLLGTCGTCGQPFGGLLDEVSLYDRVLSEGEIAALAAAGPAGKSKRLEAPALTVTLSADRTAAQLAWPLTAVGCVLEETDHLGSSTVWAPTTALPTVTNQQYTLTVKPDRGTRYYRLMRY